MFSYSTIYRLYFMLLPIHDNMNSKSLAALIAILGTTLIFATAAIVTTAPYAHARQSCDQKGGDITVNACVNANVAKNNICVGVISKSDRCTQ
jgi:hypothetical protein